MILTDIAPEALPDVIERFADWLDPAERAVFWRIADPAKAMRAAGAEGSIAILCAESTLPYYRPPLSKEFLLKDPDQTKVLIHDQAFYRDRDIDG